MKFKTLLLILLVLGTGLTCNAFEVDTGQSEEMEILKVEVQTTQVAVEALALDFTIYRQLDINTAASVTQPAVNYMAQDLSVNNTAVNFSNYLTRRTSTENFYKHTGNHYRAKARYLKEKHLKTESRPEPDRRLG